MSSAAYILIGLAIGSLLGLVTGWFLARNKAAHPNDNRLENELRTQLQQRERELTESRAQLTQNSAELAGAHANRCAAEKLLAEHKQVHAQSLAEAKSAQDKALADLREAFKALSAEALKQTQPQFLQLANETLAKFQETAKGDLAQRQESIKGLVEPLKQQLETYQKRLQQNETAQAGILGEVKQQLEGLTQNSQLLSNETLQLRKVLSSNQARGKWGEETLRRVVEAAGMSLHCDFSEQAQSGDSKPDLIVHLPGDRMIIVDAKVPDLDFLNAIDSADPTSRAEALAVHAQKLKGTIRALADRDYPRQFSTALDYVVLFMPAESLFSAALEGDRDLIVWAAQRQIMLATPASLIALLRSVSISWQQHAQTENAKEIASAAQELFNRVAKFTEHFEKIRNNLQKANEAYNDAVGSYERMVRPAGEKLVKLSGANNAKQLADILPLDQTLRLPPST
ncbi:MAG: DNA recombination protein RmuC [Verrucomicrobia bacterium]|nr:DNA recombination protein RmuC [Verrucomicrobiota bacterium]